ncbi:MAG: KaiC domain-containing protein [bacterium]
MLFDKKVSYNLENFKTYTILDNLYYYYDTKEKKTKYLNGIPKQGIIQIVGTNGTGKSLLVNNITSNVIQDKKVLYISTEILGEYVYYNIKQRCESLDLEFKEDNLLIVDLARNTDYIYDINKFFKEIVEVLKNNRIELVIIDSLTAFYENLENKARLVVRQIYNFFKKWRKTGIFISQKRSSHEENSSEAAGGYAVAHILDSTVVMIKKIIQTKWDSEDYGIEKGKMIRILRIDDCRLCLHSTKEHLFRINEKGIIEIIKEKER